MKGFEFTRRGFLTRSMLLGCSAAASPLFAPMTFAQAPWDNRLVVIILRGAMDGLDIVQPYGDRDFAGLRPGWAIGPDQGAVDLDGFFALHGAMAGLAPLWAAGELSFAHAVSTPYRDKRSHFDGQDLLEAGTPGLVGGAMRDGWLNRMLAQMPGVEADTAYAIGHEDLLVLSGAAQVANWSPDVGLNLSPQALRLAETIMHDDPLFRDALGEAMALAVEDQPVMMVDEDGDEEMASGARLGGGMMMQADDRKLGAHLKIAEFAAERLRGDSRIAAFSVNGWDTHQGQDKMIGRAATRLADTILALRDGLGPVWEKTTVVAMTEFGRTARVNGSGGTDHGTGGAMIMAGGALRGQVVHRDWPGLGPSALYQGRDVMPTRDVRAYAAWVIRGLFGIEQSVLEGAIFPGLEMGGDPKVVL